MYWSDGEICETLPSLLEIKHKVQESLKSLRQDHKRNLNPTPYKVNKIKNKLRSGGWSSGGRQAGFAQQPFNFILKKNNFFY